VYVVAEPVCRTAVRVIAEDELAEVRWVGLAEADGLLPGMFEPVRAYLGDQLYPAQPAAVGEPCSGIGGRASPRGGRGHLR
jgi:hypothetical protein